MDNQVHKLKVKEARPKSSKNCLLLDSARRTSQDTTRDDKMIYLYDHGLTSYFSLASRSVDSVLPCRFVVKSIICLNYLVVALFFWSCACHAISSRIR